MLFAKRHKWHAKISTTLKLLTCLSCAFFTSAVAEPEQTKLKADEICLSGGTFTMGSEAHYPEEKPLREVSVDAFCMDRHEVSNQQFEKFVAATGYKTVAETGPARSDYPGQPDAFFAPGSAVFVSPGSLKSAALNQWWQFRETANWRSPQGDPSTKAQSLYPVVHVAYKDALAYAKWLGRDLPTEAQWEFAAREIGANGANPDLQANLIPAKAANTWQGRFPLNNSAEDGHVGTAPVGSYPANAHGFFDLIGNVWEWTKSPYQGPAAQRTIKGGSHLCAPNYCLRYRPSARQGQDTGLGTSHIGFRTVRKLP
ncbi:MAG: formylglycine-generating enzyme family protein [Pseudomonadota bacterium]